MKKTTKIVILVFLIAIILKFALSFLVNNPIAFSDDYTYIKLARNIFYFNTFSVNSQNPLYYPPLYPLILSFTYLVKDMNLIFVLMKLINSIISSLIIFPIFLLAREFLDERETIILTIITALLPYNILFSNVIMAENLFYPLVLFSIYFIYKSFTTKKITYDILAGIFISLSYLTKTLGLGLIFVVLIPFLYKLIKGNYYEIKKKIVMAVFFILVSLPWFIRNFELFGFSLGLFAGGYPTTKITTAISSTNYLTLIGWFFVYLGYLIISSAIIFFVFNLSFIKNASEKREKILSLIVISSIFSFLIIASMHHINAIADSLTNLFFLRGRPLGRYIEFLTPLIIIGAFIGFKKRNLKFEKTALIILTALAAVVISQLIYYQLFPVNTISLSLVGGITYIIGTNLSSFLLPLLLIFLAVFVFIISKIKINYLVYVFITLMMLTSLIGYSAMLKQSGDWSKNPQIHLGEFLNDNKISNILIDRNNCIEKLTKTTTNEGICDYEHDITIIGLKTNDNILIDFPSEQNLKNNDFLISKEQYSYKIVKEENKIYIYSLKDPELK
ncbi:MAG: glycosyltransferase family 39 protein [Candidatus Nanoarchaeia archaeon]|nr:glycosyltransferase family 39 protein [Candidatus Nanoarchaeia archaeon]